MFPSSNIYTSLRKILFIFLNPIETETLLHLHANENGHSTTNEKPVRVEVVQAATDKVNAIFKYHTGEVRNISGDQNIGRGVCVYVCVRGGGGCEDRERRSQSTEDAYVKRLRCKLNHFKGFHTHPFYSEFDSM